MTFCRIKYAWILTWKNDFSREYYILNGFMEIASFKYQFRLQIKLLL